MLRIWVEKFNSQRINQHYRKMSKDKSKNVNSRCDQINLTPSIQGENYKIRQKYCFTLIKVLIYQEVINLFVSDKLSKQVKLQLQKCFISRNIVGELSHLYQANPSSTLTMGDPQRVFKISCQEPGEKSARPSQTRTVSGQTDDLRLCDNITLSFMA